MSATLVTPVVPSSKHVSWDALLELRRSWRDAGLTVVWTNGCFDLIHYGHVQSLQAARRLGDVLVVGVNSDTSVSRLKGPTRPIVPEAERIGILAALECVTFVIAFDESTPEAAIARLQPDVCCKGADYAPPNGKPVPEARVVEGYGGRLAYLPLIPAVSTTAIVQRIRQLSDG